MSTFDPLLIPFVLIVVVAFVAAITAFARLQAARRRARQRVLEQPNSHYTSHLVVQRETRLKWHDIDRERLHEINREEVVRLLAVIDAAGVDSLRPPERLFLDRMAEVAAGPAPLDRGDSAAANPAPSTLRLSPRV